MSASDAFPLLFDSSEGKRRLLLDYLPPYDKARYLINQQLMASGYFVVPITPSQVIEDLVPTFYPLKEPLDPSAFRDDMLHELALLYAVFAAGRLLSSAPQEHEANAEAESYMRLCRAALAFRGVFEEASLAAVQAIFILARDIWFAGKPRRREVADKMIVFAFQIAISVSLLISALRSGL